MGTVCPPVPCVSPRPARVPVPASTAIIDRMSPRLPAPTLDRRGLLRAGGALLSVAALAPVLASCSSETEVPVTAGGTPLPIPPLLEPDADGRLALTAARGTAQFIPDVATDTWGYNG